MYTPLFIAFRGVCCSISQREYQRHEKIALKHFILKNWVKLDYEFGSFYLRHYFFSKVFGRWYSPLQQNLHFKCVSTYPTLPRLRCLRDCVTEFNKNNRKYKIDKATVSHYMNSAQVTRYFHGNTWFINYDELEKVILRHLKAVKKRKKRKYNWI